MSGIGKKKVPSTEEELQRRELVRLLNEDFSDKFRIICTDEARKALDARLLPYGDTGRNINVRVIRSDKETVQLSQ